MNAHPPDTLNWDRLPGRTPSTSRLEKRSSSFTGKRVLITGASGYIGGALAEAVALEDPEQLVLIDMSEQGVYRTEHRFAQGKNAGQVAVTLGSICDTALMRSLLQRHKPQIIFHAAAFKHVPLLEQNPFAAIANNTLGTAALAPLAIEHGCERFVFVSTDKAADPLSIMGASKRIAEMVLLASNATRREFEKSAQTSMLPVRLGNVLNSPGSVVPVFAEQIQNGKALTVTHAGAERYFMTIEEAVAALLEAGSGSHDSGILIPHMNAPIRIGELARWLHAMLRPGALDKPKIHSLGLRPGDKMNEVLLGSDEVWDQPATTGGDTLRQVISPSFSESVVQRAIDDLRSAVLDRDLDRLIRSVRSLLPDYQPSEALLASQQTLSASTPRVGQ